MIDISPDTHIHIRTHTCRCAMFSLCFASARARTHTHTHAAAPQIQLLEVEQGAVTVSRMAPGHRAIEGVYATGCGT